MALSVQFPSGFLLLFFLSQRYIFSHIFPNMLTIDNYKDLQSQRFFFWKREAKKKNSCDTANCKDVVLLIARLEETIRGDKSKSIS